MKDCSILGLNEVEDMSVIVDEDIKIKRCIWIKSRLAGICLDFILRSKPEDGVTMKELYTRTPKTPVLLDITADYHENCIYQSGYTYS